MTEKNKPQLSESVQNVHLGKSCFIITPIGGDNTDVRRHADGVITSVLKPLLKDIFGFKKVVAAHDMTQSGSINTQVMNAVIDSDLVIANLTGLNPNVMYELAVRHATQKPIIHLCSKDGTKLPFDIVDQRTIFYENDMLGVNELKNQLTKFLKSIKYDEIVNDNPIYNSKRKKIIYDELNIVPTNNKGDYTSTLKYLVDQIDSIQNKLSPFNNKLPSFKKESYKASFTGDLSFNVHNFKKSFSEYALEADLSVKEFKVTKIRSTAYFIDYDLEISLVVANSNKFGIENLKSMLELSASGDFKIINIVDRNFIPDTW